MLASLSRAASECGDQRARDSGFRRDADHRDKHSGWEVYLNSSRGNSGRTSRQILNNSTSIAVVIKYRNSGKHWKNKYYWEDFKDKKQKTRIESKKQFTCMKEGQKQGEQVTHIRPFQQPIRGLSVLSFLLCFWLHHDHTYLFIVYFNYFSRTGYLRSPFV